MFAGHEQDHRFGGHAKFRIAGAGAPAEPDHGEGGEGDEEDGGAVQAFHPQQGFIRQTEDIGDEAGGKRLEGFRERADVLPVQEPQG